jgi:hypothetical protein
VTDVGHPSGRARQDRWTRAAMDAGRESRRVGKGKKNEGRMHERALWGGDAPGREWEPSQLEGVKEA